VGATEREETMQARLAMEGGPKACAQFEAAGEPKIGVEEFFSIAQRFGFSDAALQRLRAAVTNADLPPGGPMLGRYHGSPAPTCGERYEAAAKAKFGVKYALPVSSGTGALHAAFVAVGVGPGTEVIVPATGFIATSAAVCLAGGRPVFCDVDRSMQMDPTKIEALITPRTVALAPTHHWGGVCDMDPIMAIARRHKLKVVEDCAQSPGGKYRGRYVGTFGDVGCFSISCYKIIGGGESGLVLTNDQRLYERAAQLAEGGGLWRGADRFAPPRYDGELFVGTNYRMSELEAAVDLVQLGKLDDVVRRYNTVRRQIVAGLQTFREIEPETNNDPAGAPGYQLRFYPQTIALAAKIARALQAEGIHALCRGANPQPDWHIYHEMFPVTLQHPAPRGQCPVADDLWERGVVLCLDQWYTPNDCRQIAQGMNKVFAAYGTPDPKANTWS
jgi:dTDP-4-amino-4,6-dideoxygalactose transaminase